MFIHHQNNATIFYGLVFMALSLLSLTHVSLGNHEHFQSYLDHRDFYMHNFNEMLARKDDMYQAKHSEYSNRVNNYKNIDREDTRHHSEADDEQGEINHEQGEVHLEHHTEQVHDRRRKRFVVFKKDIKDVVQTPKQANQFLRKRRKKS